MNEERTHWTTEDLELYHDGELDAARRAELAGALRRDPALRERYGVVCRVDDNLLAAFLAQQVEHRRLPRTISLLRSPAAVAACLLFAAVLTGWYAFSGRIPDGKSQEDLYAEADADIEPPYEAVRIVFSLPVRAQPQASAVTREDNDTVLESASGLIDATTFVERIDSVLKGGHDEDALALLDGASQGQRQAVYRHLGGLIRSAEAAERVLDRLSREEQLAACKEWAREPGMRTTAFARLRRLSGEPELAGDVRSVVAGLSREPQLLPWLRSYQLIGDASTRSDASG